jgi:hypothetical protein
MIRHIRILEVLVIAVLILSGYTASAQELNVYKGELTSGSVKTGSLSSNELWILYGEKGSRVVISTVVDMGSAPPEIYLYPPGSSKSEAHSDLADERSQVLDYKLDSAGKFEVLIHPCDAQEKTGYKIAYATIDPGDSYTIRPDDPNGNLIVEKNLDSQSSKIIMDRSGGIAPASILLNLVTFGTGPVVFYIISGLDEVFVGAENLNNRVEVASRVIEKPAEQCNIKIAGIGYQ